MDNFPILCTICEQTVKGDQAYLEHMQTEHGTTSTTKAIEKAKAIKQNVPQSIPISKDIPPTDEFMEVAKVIDSRPPVVRSEVGTTTPEHSSETQQQEVKPLELKYRWEGNCPKCNTPIKTVVIKAMGKWFAVAFCLTHEEIDQQEVTPLVGITRVQEEIKIKDLTKILKKGGVKRVKRSKPIILSNSPISTGLSATGLSKTNEQGIQN